MASVQDGKSRVAVVTDHAAARTAVETARKLLEGGDADGAAAALRAYATREEAGPAELADAAKILATAGAPVEAVGRYLEAGRGFLAAGDPVRARQSFASAYELDGKNMDALFELGRVDVAEGKKHDGLDKFVEILRKSNLKHLPALFEAGCLYEQDGQHNQAILAFKRVVEKDKGHAGALEHLGGLHKVRNQLPEAVDFYARASEAAHLHLRNEDAVRLAKAALDIDGSNAQSHRVLGEAERALAQPQTEAAQGSAPIAATATTTAAPAAAPATAQPAQTSSAQPAAAKPEVSGIGAAAPAAADPPMPPPPPSTLNIELPPDVALLEQQSQAMAKLAQVQNAVAQTYKQRLAIEEEIRRAQVALEALQRQQQSVDDDLSGRRDELAKVVAQREKEDAALAALGDAIAKSKAELTALADVPALVEATKAQCAQAAEHASRAVADSSSVGSQIEAVKSKAAAADAGVDELTKAVQTARQAVVALEAQLASASEKAKGVHGSADAAAGAAAAAKSAADALAAHRQAIEGSVSALSASAENVERKRSEAEAAIARLEALQAQRTTQFEEIVFKLPPLVSDAVKAAQPASTAAPVASDPAPVSGPAAAPKPAASPAAAPPSGAKADAPATVDSLIAAGRFADAAARAQTEANAQPKPAEYLVDVADRLRAAGKAEEAVKLYAAARDRDQSNARARYELGSALVDLGKTDEAIAALQSIESVPDYAVLGQVAIGRCLRRKGELEAAEQRFSKALEVEGRPESDYHQALYQLADMHESKGDPESLGLALWSFEELQTSDPHHSDVAQRIERLKSRMADGASRPEPKRNGAVKQ